MENGTTFHRRSVIRIVSFTLAALVALSAAAIGGYAAANRSRTSMEYSYQRALGELTDYVNNINIALEKGKYASTEKQLQGLSNKLWRETGYAKSALNQLPVNGTELSATYKFLSQLGSFCVALSNRVSESGTITEEDSALMDQLTDYAAEISGHLASMESALDNGQLSFAELEQAAVSSGGAEEVSSGLSDGFREMEEGFEDYPTLIYDGPFSDHIQQQTPRLTEGKETLSAEAALQKAKDFTGNDALTLAEETGGNLPCYRFEADTLTVSITKAGGYTDYFYNSREIGEATLTAEQALEAAREAIQKMAPGEYTNRYYSISGGVLTANFAAKQGDTVLYPDLIKVGVAMDTGEVLSFDGRGYIMNHTDRALSEPALTLEAAQAVLSPRLTVKSSGLALIPDNSLGETLCWEFSCEGEDDDQVLVYINAENGMEEEILILLEDETGVLSM